MMEKKLHALLHALRTLPPFVSPSSIKTIISPYYPEHFLQFHSYVFTLPALKIHAKNAVELYLMVVMGKWRVPPRALNIFHRTAVPPGPRIGM